MNIELVPAKQEDRTTLDNLLQLYIHDFSEHWAGRPDGELEPDGRFAPYPLDPYWSDVTCIPLLVKVDSHLAGFVLLNAQSHVDAPVDHNVAEFFIVRKHRRCGVGTRVIQQIFDRYPGQWEIAVARRNVSALAFWRKVVAQRANEVDDRDVQSSRWNGFVLRFRIEPRPQHR